MFNENTYDIIEQEAYKKFKTYISQLELRRQKGTIKDSLEYWVAEVAYERGHEEGYSSGYSDGYGQGRDDGDTRGIET